MEKFDHKNIEAKWQKIWDEEKVFRTGDDDSKPKYFVLDMFPYPSGNGLHIGHVKGYAATDVLANMKRMQGFNVLHPMGWDAFGLPAENFAIKNKTHPKIQTEKNIAYFKEQMRGLGFSYDWDREINTTDPEYYKWSQWAFIKMWEKGLAYESWEPIIWCPKCQTGLAMEDLENGKCERCESEVERKPMRQWVIKITEYADRLLADLDKLPGWEDSIKEMQRNWIGRSEGAEIEFSIFNFQFSIKVFTTRPDTLFGVTYVVLAPENPLVENLKSQISNLSDVEEYIKKTKAKSDLERTDLNKDKSGVKLEGVMAINPANGEEVPVFIADYVLANYGTGAVMAVPAHDERDFEFARKYDLPIKYVVQADSQINQKLLASLKLIKKQADEDDVKFWLLGGLSLAFYSGFTYRDIGDIDLIARNDDDFRKMLTILEKCGFEKKQEEKLSEKLTNFYFENKEGVGADIGPYVGEYGLEDKHFEDGEKVLGDVSCRVLAREFVHGFKEKQCRERGAEKDNLDCEYLNGRAFVDSGVNFNSDFLNGLPTAEAKKKMIVWLEENNHGQKKVNYKLQDWVFSRQRYWGDPIPFVHCEKCGTVPVPESELPIRLPDVENYEPSGTGESPLANITDWVNTTCPKCGGKAKRETNTMPQWAGSSWYYLRYIDPHNSEALVDKEKEKYWSPVDFYVGGAEHATRHLIYARFWHKFLFDIGVVNYEEPFKALQHVGLVLGNDGKKISKRLNNGANPLDVAAEYGADALRCYENFIGPFNQPAVWSNTGPLGVRRFLDKVWTIADNSPLSRGVADVSAVVLAKVEGRGVFLDESSREIKSLLHKTIKKITEDVADFKLNTCISSLMILANAIEATTTPSPSLERRGGISNGDFAKFIQILAPFAPHLSEEIWREKLGNKESVFKSAWPIYDKELIKDDIVNLVVQVNGKLRATISVPAEITQDEAMNSARENENVKKYLEGAEIIKIIFVAGKLLNIVVK
jgi:leucyl-tRNA synthetase